MEKQTEIKLGAAVYIVTHQFDGEKTMEAVLLDRMTSLAANSGQSSTSA